MLQIRDYHSEDAVEIADLYHASVHAIDDKVYSRQQQEAWAPTPPDYHFWQQRLQRKRPFVAWQDNRIVGFIELEDDGHIDCAYTHPEFQRQGVMSALYQYLQQQAQERNISKLHVEASKVAHPFFEKQGFYYQKTNKVNRGGVALINYTLVKRFRS